MSKINIDIKTNAYFPSLNKSATWEDAWESCQSQNYDLEIYDHIIPKTRPSRYSLEITLVQTLNNTEKVIHKFELTGEERMTYAPTNGDFDLQEIYKLCVLYLIQNKYIRKPKNSSRIQAQKASDLEDLKKQRQRLQMKMYAWKKRGKDITELENQKNVLNKQIKSLS